MANIPDVLYYYRAWPGQTSARHHALQNKKLELAQKLGMDINTNIMYMKTIAYLLSISLVCFCTCIVHAQQKIRSDIEGTIKDSLTGKFVEYASVLLFLPGDSIAKTGVVTNQKGRFEIKDIPPNTYTLAISIVGYKRKELQLTIPGDGKKADLGEIGLVMQQDSLATVIVSGRQSKVIDLVDKLVYIAEKDSFPERSNGLDVIKRAPLVEVGFNDEVKVKGSNQIQVLINGKPSNRYASTMQEALRIVPAEEIKNVEIITSPSLKYESSGSTAIINIITKRTNLVGITGNSSLVFFSNQGASERIGLNVRTKKLSVGMTANTGKAFPGFTKYTESQIKENNPDRQTSQVRHINSYSINKDRSYNIMGVVNAAYEINKKNTLSASLNRSNHYLITSNNYNDESYSISNSLINQMTREKNVNTPSIVFGSSIDYTRTFNKEGKEFGISAAYALDKEKYRYTQAGSIEEKFFDEKINKDYTVQTDYTVPLSQKLFLESGAKAIFRSRSSDAAFDSLNHITGKYENDHNRNSAFDYNENVFSGYSTVTWRLPKQFGLKVGARLEYSTVKADYLQFGETENTDKNYITLLPVITLSKLFGQVNSIKLNYDRQVFRPSLYYLNPYLNNSNPYFVMQGNPQLQPQATNNVNISFFAYLNKTSSLSFTAGYAWNDKMIESVSTTMNNGGNYTTYLNTGKYSTQSLNAYYTVDPVKQLKLNFWVNVQNYHLQKTQISTLLPSNTFSFTAQFSTYITLPKENLIFWGCFVEPSTRISTQSTARVLNPFDMSLGWQKKFMKNRAALVLSVSNLLKMHSTTRTETKTNQFYQSNDNEAILRNLYVGFKYSFGRLKFKDDPPRFRNRIENTDVKKDKSEERQ